MGPGFWKFNNSLFSDTKFVELLNFLIPEFAKKNHGIEDKGFFWEMIKMEIRAFTIQFSKKKAKCKGNKESALLPEMTKLQTPDSVQWFPQAWFPYDRPDRPSRLKIGPSDRDDHMET